MLSILLTADQVKTAPEEVRRWIEATVRRELSLEAHTPYQRNGFRYAENGLAICALAEVSQIFTLLRRDPDACRLFLALGCDNYDRAHGTHTARPVPLDRLAQHLGLADPTQLVALLETINNALRQERADADAALFAIDGETALFVDPETQWHIFQLLQLLSGTEERRAATPGARPGPAARPAAAPVSVTAPYHAAPVAPVAPPHPRPAGEFAI